MALRSPIARLSALIAALLAIAPPSAAAASEVEAFRVTGGEAAADVARERFEEIRARILRRIAEPGVGADLYELMDLVSEAGSLERAADLLGTVARSSRAQPEVRATAHRHLATVERWRGRLPRMEASLAAIGTIREAAVIGPFDDENGSGFDVAYGPEVDLDLSSSHQGLRSEVSWRTPPDLGRTGTLVLDEVIRPTNGALAFALTILEVPADAKAVLYLGTSGPTKAWLGGKAVFADRSSHPARFDQRAVPIHLRRGKNPLLLKVSASSAGSLRLELRVVGENGAPIRGLVASAPEPGSRWPKPEAIPDGREILGRRPLVDALEGLARGGRARALEDLARLLGARHPFDDADRLHAVAAKRAADAAPERVEAQLLAARFHEDDGNERRHFLERAALAERSGRATAHAALAGWWLANGYPHRALEILRPRLAEAPGDWMARIVWARALDVRGEQAAAMRFLDEALASHPAEPALLQQRASLHLRDGQAAAAARMLRVLLGLRPASLEAAVSLASTLVDAGRIAEADQALASVARLQPLNLGLVLRRADLAAANGSLEDARKLYARAAEICPQESDVFERWGRAELRAGDEARALAAFERALAVRPQNVQLRELVRSLRPGDARFAERFLRDLRAVAEEARERFPDEDAVKAVDLQVVRVLPNGQASRTVQRIVHVRNTRGVERFRLFQISYAPDRQELRIERARILRPDGTIVDGHTERDRSMNEPWSGLYYDARATVVGFPSLAPGDTVELVWRLEDVGRDNLLSDYFGDVDFLGDTVSTLDWEYVLEMPSGRAIHANSPAGAVRTEEPGPGGSTLHRWRARDVARVIPEPLMPGWVEVAPYLHVSTYRDWESVARYWWGLVKDQVAPTPEIERVAKEITAGIPPTDVEGRVRAVYDFVVTRTRYVGLEFGIHSFKPYRVEQVLRRGFGDCKDKASLAWSLLRALGIDSKLVLLRMRHLGRIGAEPASLAVFNHAILYVPSLDLYLDGTAEWSGSRELPESDRGAEVLVVDPDGRSEFRVTPEAPASLSSTDTTYRVSLATDGGASLSGRSVVRGLGAPGYRQSYASPSGRIATFEQSWARSFPGVTVTRLDVSDPREIEDDVRLDYDLEIPDYADVSLDGTLTFSPTRPASTMVESFAPLSTRRSEVVLRYPWSTTFRYEIELPGGYAPSGLPEASRIESPFGRVEVGYAAEGGAVVITGSIEIATARIPPEAYAEFRSFLGRADSVLARKIVAAPAGTASR
ncbi:MAG TPA: DUF3857 domain-containing protein [Vulgatibacter sp.]|nr:DUF3857 domain-containing protein [Vulgatibacter sp.]